MNVVLIAGPTASGKSSAAIRIAEQRDGVIVNADSMQVYDSLKVLTARPGAADEARVPHRLYGYIPASERCSVARWLADAKTQIEQAQQTGKLPIIVGGTGLYFKALEDGLAEVPEIDADIRRDVRVRLGKEGAPVLHDELAKLDRSSAEKLKPGDGQRIARALEVVLSTGKPLSYFYEIAAGKSALAGMRIERQLILPPREILYQRINQRFDNMLEAGGLQEVRALLEKKLEGDLPVMKAIGVRALGSYLHGACDLDSAIERAKQETRNYAKRQMTWFRNQTPDWPVVVNYQ